MADLTASSKIKRIFWMNQEMKIYFKTKKLYLISINLIMITNKELIAKAKVNF